MMNQKYFGLTLADEPGISGDDLNRRHRESRLGFTEPSADWANAGREIRCLWDGQTITKLKSLTCKGLHLHVSAAFVGPIVD